MENDQRKLFLAQRFKTSKVTPIVGTNMTCGDYASTNINLGMAMEDGVKRLLIFFFFNAA
jgi:hypothetical protein